MPEQNVQVTPSAPKFNTHKVFAAIGIILTVAIIAVAAIWYFTDSSSSSDDESGTTVKVSTSSAKPATKSATSAAK